MPQGQVQEELLFLEHPELLMSKLLIRRVSDNEAFMVRGVWRTCDVDGYGRTFAYKPLGSEPIGPVDVRQRGSTGLGRCPQPSCLDRNIVDKVTLEHSRSQKRSP